jgi:hypothetical protein
MTLEVFLGIISDITQTMFGISGGTNNLMTDSISSIWKFFEGAGTFFQTIFAFFQTIG